MKNQKLRIYLHINNYMYPLCWNIFEHHLLDIFHPRVARLVPLSSRLIVQLQNHELFTFFKSIVFVIKYYDADSL